MYFYLGCKVREIQDHDWLKVFILSYQEEECVVTSYYLPYNEQTVDLLNCFDRFQDVTKNVRFFVKRDGKVSISLVQD